MRKRLKQHEAEELGFEWKGIEPNGRNPRYNLTPEQEKQLQQVRSEGYETERFCAWDKNGKFIPIEDFCRIYGLPYDNIKSHKIVSHTGIPYYNILFKDLSQGESVLDMESVFKKFTFKRKKNKVEQRQANGFDRLVLTDVHIGMNPDAEGVSMYDNSWELKDIEATRQRIVNEVVSRQWSEVLVIEQLGDLLDGFNAQTTRGGHALPQNMSNQEQFDNAIKFLHDLVDDLFPFYSVIRLENVCNDNHAGDFGYMACQAVKMLLEAKFEDVMVTNHTQFISHYIVGQSLSVISHGKDKVHNKFGFKPVLDTKQIEKIDQYIKFHKLYQYENIRFAKGDSHQAIFDDTTSNDFSYNSYPALSPASEWVQSNFKNSKRGFSFESEERETGIVTRSMIYL
jgi:hypothetical protein